MSVNQLIARGGVPVDTSGTRGEIARMQQADQYRNQLMQREDAQLSREQAQQAQEDAEDDHVAGLLQSGRYDEALAIDPENTQLFMQAKGIDPQSVYRNKQLTQDQSQFTARLGQDQSQFSARLRQDQSQFTAQERRLSQPSPKADDDFARYAAMTEEERALYDRMKGRNATGGGITVGEDGQLMVSPDPSKATEGERVASNYAGRMEAAESLFGDYAPSATEYMAARAVLQNGPVVASIANRTLSAESQQYYQAAADWVRAKLRKESGAVISPEEMEQEIKTYFPLPNDKPETRAQKKKARLQAFAGMQQMSGRASPSRVTQRPGQGPPAQSDVASRVKKYY
jgi:hypothetical protein